MERLCICKTQACVWTCKTQRNGRRGKVWWMTAANKCLCKYVEVCVSTFVRVWVHADALWHSSNTPHLTHQMLSKSDLVLASQTRQKSEKRSNSICHTEVTRTHTHMEGRWEHSCRCQWRCLERCLEQGLAKIQDINKHQHGSTCSWYEHSAWGTAEREAGAFLKKLHRFTCSHRTNLSTSEFSITAGLFCDWFQHKKQTHKTKTPEAEKDDPWQSVTSPAR